MPIHLWWVVQIQLFGEFFRQSCGQAAANCLAACALRAPFAFRDWLAPQVVAFMERMIGGWRSRQNMDPLEPGGGGG